MGREWYRSNCISCFRAKFKPNEGTQLQNLHRPKEADATDGVPYIDSDKDPDILIIRSINPCIADNGLAHHTAKYEIMNRKIEPELVVRRGQPFRLELNLSRAYDQEKDGLSFIFTVDEEDQPSFGHGTLVAIPLLKKHDRNSSWNAVLDQNTDTTITVQITPSAECIVSQWRLEVDTRLLDNNAINPSCDSCAAYSYSCSTAIYILYNPWCMKDQVYMRSEEWRDECVLEDVGLVWRGTANRQRPCIWKYAQFEKDVLNCSLYLIRHIGQIYGNTAADPVATTRALAAAVNSVDDEGAVMGNWSTDFSDGTAPSKWMGSKEILQKYYKKKKPVKYGQCWVFSGVLTTICRAIGIPARPVTNYASAHDTHRSLTVDHFLDETGASLPGMNTDSVWNFHVWVEVWMHRPDLGSSGIPVLGVREYGGWQVVDATPQEESDNMYRCGPASVEAVRRGEIKRPYDVGFLYAEVNADKVYWRYTGPNKPLKLLRKDTYAIGKLISTKAAGKFEREDITITYKHPDHTMDERDTMLKALRQSENRFSRYYLNETFHDIYFHFELRDDIKIGEPFSVSLVMRNRHKEVNHKINVLLRLTAVTYTGKTKQTIITEEYNVEVASDSVHEIKLNATYDDYGRYLEDQASFNVSCLATVAETNFEHYAEEDFRVRKPDVKLSLQGDVIVVGTEVTGDIWLENPLPVALKKCVFIVEPPGVDKGITVRVKKNVNVGEKAHGQFKFTPVLAGRQTIAAKFFSKELDDVDGYVHFVAIEKSDEKKEENGA